MAVILLSLQGSHQWI
uniref:Uncharacterized protein n=1 Tax=Arundo donax TaxID=35708 RepID=A0A0A9GBA7_ARUDO